MRLACTVLVWLAVAAHMAFLIYLPLGGLLALRWRRTIGVHVVAVLWAVASVAGRLPCPLTDLERWARARAGMAPLDPGGFIDHYITGVLYPAAAAGYVQAALAAVVAASWVAYARGTRIGAGGRAGAEHRNAFPE